ncbi:MAG: 30S ribosomal protein S7 [Armatimonadetes bacterium]|nr:30S ribosomal protein S7 [Armatimonadota bacterium]NIM24249.1 30S ribosomal protein S7 [Armatimonadota bacterium]NIM68118.1 30S ribosomal protein S7 [Armatimonadota bacterium]NIM76580.1 30S ribosomal protein S7 [Armatimonadota bacterium]NIN06323.1 30S ribosomal protein S7 [Armatimonadota bacterium]
MPRKGAVPKRGVLADPVFNSRLVTKFINCLLTDGKKSVAENIFYSAMAHINERTGRDPLQIFEQAMRNTMPVLEVKPRRVGGATYQVPSEVRPSRKITLAIRWLIAAGKARSGRTMYEKLAAELMDAASGSGAAVKKREDTHRMAEANRAFAHYRW